MDLLWIYFGLSMDLKRFCLVQVPSRFLSTIVLSWWVYTIYVGITHFNM